MQNTTSAPVRTNSSVLSARTYSINALHRRRFRAGCLSGGCNQHVDLGHRLTRSVRRQLWHDEREDRFESRTQARAFARAQAVKLATRRRLELNHPAERPNFLRRVVNFLKGEK